MDSQQMFRQCERPFYSHVEHKRRTCVHYRIELVFLQYLIECVGSSNIGNDDELELVRLEGIAKVSCLGLGADGSNNVVAALKEDSDKRDGNKTICTSDKD